jgi:hypothetical protein
MALTVTLDGFPRLLGNRKVVTGTVTFDSSYPTGGESITLIQLGLSALQNLDVTNEYGSSTTAYMVTWNKSATAPKLFAYMGDNNNASDGPFIEVANTTDLSALVCRFEATGW